jgi:hypothetical protein
MIYFNLELGAGLLQHFHFLDYTPVCAYIPQYIPYASITRNKKKILPAGIFSLGLAPLVV